jgi:hypothetical protein
MNLSRPLTVASLAVAGWLAAMSAGASAATLPMHSQPQLQNAVELAQYRRHVERRWDRHRHGPRYSHRRHGFHHYHRGYWYRTPWWSLSVPLVVPPVVAAPSYGGSHVAYCENKYRSYDRRTDLYLGYDGEYHRCVSPY